LEDHLDGSRANPEQPKTLSKIQNFAHSGILIAGQFAGLQLEIINNITEVSSYIKFLL
jgi:hypothetical protein